MFHLLLIPAAAVVGYLYGKSAGPAPAPKGPGTGITNPGAAATVAVSTGAVPPAAASPGPTPSPQLQAQINPTSTQINVGDQVIVSTDAIAGIKQVAPALAGQQIQMEIDSISSPSDPTGIFVMAHVTDPHLDATTKSLLVGSFPIARAAIVAKV
jgi:hypothetical protein